MRVPRSTSTWTRMLIALLSSTTCVGYCGARISMSPKSLFLSCKLVQPCIVVGMQIHYDQAKKPVQQLAFIGCSHMCARN